MKPSQRLTLSLRTTGIPVWDLGNIRTLISESAMTGAQLAAAIANARDRRDAMDACIEAMEKVLDEGETVEEHRLRIAAEDADPMVPAMDAGWFAIEDFALLCDPGPNGFRKRLAGITGRIVKPTDEAVLKRLLGTDWPEYSAPHEYWADHFIFADSWRDALDKVRKGKRK